MDINRTNMDGLFKAYNAAFTEGMQRGREIPAELMTEFASLNDIAMIVPSTTKTEVHAWLNQIPGFKEWVGERTYQNISSNKLEVVNKDWEQTVAVDRNDIEDDKVGLYAPLMQAMGSEASDNALWLDLCITALTANGNWVDGKAFFVTNRVYGAQTINNITTVALSGTTLEAGLTAMLGYKGAAGNPLSVVPVYLLVGPALRDTAWDLVVNQFVSAGSGRSTAGAIQNRTKGRLIMKVHPGLSGTYANYWFILGRKGGISPVACQRRKAAQFVALDNFQDEHVFKKREFLYGADARGTGFLTLPHLAYGGLVSA